MTVTKTACLQCRRLKIKCDRSVPNCFNCIKRGKSCEFPHLFRNHSLELLSDELKDENNHDSAYYGSSSSNFLERVLSRKVTKLEAKPVKLYPLPMVAEDTDHNVEMLQLLIREMQSSHMGLFYRYFVDLEKLSVVVLTSSLVDIEIVVLCLGVALCANRHLRALSERRLESLKSELAISLEECHLFPAKVSAMILLIEFCYTRFAINSAYRYLFLAASESYALGLHELKLPIWTVLCFFDAIICSSAGRPSAIGKNCIASELSTSSDCGMSIMARVIWNCNMELQSRQPMFSHILEIDAEFDLVITKLKHSEAISPQLVMVLTANQIKMHYAHIINDYSRYKMLSLIEDIIRSFKSLIEDFQKQSKAKKPRMPNLNIRCQLPYLWCFFYQSLLVLLALIKNNQISTEKIESELNLLFDAVHKSSVNIDPILVEVLELVRTSIAEKPTSNSSEISASFNFDNTQLFHEVEFWSSLASAENSSWSTSLS